MIEVVLTLCNVDLNYLEFEALQMVSELTFAAMGTCGLGVAYIGFIVRVSPAGCTVWHMCRH